MTLDRLWAGWRLHYVDGAAREPNEGQCLFCGLGSMDPSGADVIAENDDVYVVPNAYPYTSGHLLVVPRRHVAALDALDAREAGLLMEMMRSAATAVTAAYRPDGINIGMNLGRAAEAGIPGHLHVHVLPRWHADTNFMTSVAEARVLPESLPDTLERLRAAWPT